MNTNPQESPVPMAIGSVSPSKLAAAACPYRHHELYVVGTMEPDTGAQLLGTLGHAVAWRYFDHLRETKQVTDFTALDKISGKLWKERDDRIPVDSIEDYKLFIERIRSFGAIPDPIIGVEMRLAFDSDWRELLWEENDVAYGGIVDLMYGTDEHLTIVDWTTASLAGAFAQRKSLQVKFYGLLAYMRSSVSEVTCRVVSLRTGAEITLDLTDEDHLSTAQAIRAERDRINARTEFPAVPGHQCGMCSLECPYEQKYDLSLRVSDSAQAAELHRDLIALEARRKKLMERLKKWVTVHGDVHNSGLRAGLTTSFSKEYPPHKFYELLRKNGFSLDEALDMMSVDRRVMAKMLKQHPGLIEQADSLATIRSQERFRPMISEVDGGDEE